MTRTSPTAAATALRTCSPCSHEELIVLLAQLQGLLQKNGALSGKCTSVCVDLLDEVVGQVENNQIEQQQEAAWASREDVPACAGTWASLDALTVWSQALYKISGKPA